MRQYPIWNEVRAVGGKKSPANFGARDSFRQMVYVGTSSSNSHKLALIEVERREQHDGTVEFALYVDSVMIKRGILDGKQFSIDIDSQVQEAGEAPFNDRALGNFDGIKQAN